MLTKKTPKTNKLFLCEICDFKCSKQSEWNRHLLTLKHVNIDKCLHVKRPTDLFKKYTCHCGKEYSHRQSLHIHKKKCLKVNSDYDTENVQALLSPSEPELGQNIFIKVIDKNPQDLSILTNLVLEVVKSNSELLKQNGEFQKQTNELQKQNLELNKQVMDVYQKIQPMTINNNSNSHNKTFNLNFFLNEQCKDAMNIMEFVDTFQLQLSDLERIGEVGYVEGISSIVIDKLNQMDIYKRPIHCSDAKREIMHVKDKDVWEKDTPTNAKIRLALKHITKKNTDMLRPWVNAHPGVLDSEHRLNDKYQQLFIEAMGGNSGTLTECEAKIIKKISKMVLIDKNMQ